MSWASEQYPETWKVPMKIGRRQNELGLCQFKIKREFKA